MALSLEETRALSALYSRMEANQTHDALMDAYYEGTQRLRRIGIAVPPELAQFETAVNWPRLVVDALEERCDVKSFIRANSDAADSELREGWDANNLDSEFPLAFLDSLVFGRSFLSVGANEDDPEHPRISIESPREMVVDVDPRTRRLRSALKAYGAAETFKGSGRYTARYGTLYMPDVTVWLERDANGKMIEVDRDVHRLGRVPVVPLFNRRRAGVWSGVSEMADAIPLTDAAARSLTNLQIAAETHSVPQKWALGFSRGDFVDADGKPLPVWQAYFSSIMMSENEGAKVGQYSASDLSNFHKTVEHYSGLLAGMYGLPTRYFGQNTANPPSADGIRADEARLVKRAERKNSANGDQLGRLMAYYLRIKTGEWPDGDRIKVEFHDPGTPTYAAKVDGIQKLTGGKPVLSIEGGWDELGWSDARKERERARLRAEANDPALLSAGGDEVSDLAA